MLLMDDFNVWVPLIRDKDFFESNPQVLPLHSILSVTLEDFIRITDSEPRLWPSHSRVKWSHIFSVLGLRKFQFSNEGHYMVNSQRRSLRWVNFNPDGNSCPKDYYVRQESVRFCFWSRQCARIGKIGKNWYETDSARPHNAQQLATRRRSPSRETAFLVGLSSLVTSPTSFLRIYISYWVS